MIDGISYLVGIFLGAALGQFTIAAGWCAAAAGIICGYRRSSWLSVQMIGLVGGLVAWFIFKDSVVALQMGGLPGQFMFNVFVYIIIASVGYALGWIVMRVLRKDGE